MTNSQMVQVVIYDAPTAGKSGSSCGCGCDHHDHSGHDQARTKTPWPRSAWNSRPGPWP